MVKLTPDLIEQSAQYTNPIKDRELDLRGYKIPTIENLGATLDQFDVIDFSDNDIRKLDGFPLLKRLSCLLLNNNRICRIGENLQESLPNLKVVILTNNSLQELGDIDPLASVKTLTHLSLMKNSICTKKNYRLYVIHKLPQVLCLDFKKVKLKERETASQLFKGKKGKQLEKELSKKTKTFVPGGGPVVGGGDSSTGRPSAADVEALKAAISKAKTLEEVERLNQMLKSGQFHAARSTGEDQQRQKSAEEDGSEPMETDK